MGEYHDLYLKTDVLLLADVFENFRTNCITSYKLDPVHYYTLPGFAWDVSLLMTGEKLDVFSEEQNDMYLMTERGIRGGISVISHRHSKAYNKYLPEFDKKKYPNKKSKYLPYLDAKNLYGWAMMQLLPTGNYNGKILQTLMRNVFWNSMTTDRLGIFLMLILSIQKSSTINTTFIHLLHTDSV